MAATPATIALEKAGVSFRVHTYETTEAADVSYGEAVAAAIGAPPARVFKTLIAGVDGDPIVGIVPVTGSLVLKALARAAGGKNAAMVDPADAERLTGYVTGGISPFGQRRRLRVIVDRSIEDHSAIFVSGGRRGVQLEIAPADLVAVTGAMVADIAGS